MKKKKRYSNPWFFLSLVAWRQEQDPLSSIETELCLPVCLLFKLIMQALCLYLQTVRVCLFRMWLLLIKVVLIECLCHEWLVACLKLHGSIYMIMVYFSEPPVWQYWEITKGCFFLFVCLFLLFSWVILKDIAVILDYWHCCLGIKT